MECAAARRVRRRSRSPIDASSVEAGPIRISTAADMGTRWSAIVFTLLAAVAIVAAVTNAGEWVDVLSGVLEPAASAGSVP